MSTSHYFSHSDKIYRRLLVNTDPEAYTAPLAANIEGEQDQISPPKSPRSTSLQASFTLFKVFVSSGILALPIAFSQVGFGLGILGMISLGFLTYYCMRLLLQVIDDMNACKNINLQMLTLQNLGKWGKASVDISLTIMQMGIATAILIFAMEFVDRLSCDYNLEGYCHNHWVQIGFVVIVVVPLSFINNMHYFYYPSLLATFLILVSVIVQMAYNFDRLFSKDASIAKVFEFNFLNLPHFFGVAAYSFEGIGVIFSIRAIMHKPENFPKVLKIQMFIVGLLYVIFPGISELALGDDVPDIVLFSLPLQKFYLVIKIAYVISALLGYPMQLFPVFIVIEKSRRFKHIFFDENERPQRRFLRFMMRMVMISFMLIIAVVAKSFNLFLNLLGSGIFTYLGYLLPIVIYQVYFKKRAPVYKTVLNCIFFVINVVLGLTGIYVSLKGIIELEK